MSTEAGSDGGIAEQLRTAAADAQQIADVTRAQTHAERLVAALKSHGLVVAGRLPMFSVRNPAVAGEGPQGTTMSPGLGQQILIRNYENLGLTWCWVWPSLRSAERDVPTPPPEIEPMCPIEDIDEAVRRIAVVLHIRDDEAAEESGHE
jgi:hypothetical protein